jgi:hypothetical protein
MQGGGRLFEIGSDDSGAMVELGARGGQRESEVVQMQIRVGLKVLVQLLCLCQQCRL